MVILLVVSLFALFNFACPFKRDDSDLHPVGPNLRADLLIYFKAGATSDEINSFSKSVLSRPHPEGRGDYLAPGVSTFLLIGPVQGHEGIAITFFPGATKEQREDLRRTVESAPIVHKVLENRAPSDVKKID
jgi:hypothetical protein